ncbi:MAG: RsmE family RNA methyltransferase [Candidatus Ratteibacteria bacterium]|jgi:16S rRNA (uracil1498-N3)-methyltransferase
MRRIYLDPADCEKKHNDISITGHSFHYLSNVLRIKDDDVFSGFDGSGNEYKILVKQVTRTTILGDILQTETVAEIEPSFNIHLFQSVSKGNKMDKIIGEVAQLGVRKIYPVISNRVIPQITEKNILHKKGRWQRIAVESSKIAGRTVVLGIENPMDFTKAVEEDADIKLLFWEKSSLSLKDVIQNLPELEQEATINVFIGPEGGYTDEEAALAEKSGIINVSMGKRIFKVETASVIAVALIVYELENR